MKARKLAYLLASISLPLITLAVYPQAYPASAAIAYSLAWRCLR